MELHLFWNFILAILIGGLIGIEREMPSTTNKVEDGRIAGIRSYALIALLGALMAWLDISMDTGHLWQIIGFITSAFLIMIGYSYMSFRNGHVGVTSEYATLVTYILGIIAMYGEYILAVILTILILMLLSGKERLRIILQKFSREELSNSLKFAVISLVVLPLLPNHKYSIAYGIDLIMGTDLGLTHPILTMDFFNPFSIWFFVVIMAGVEYVGYILSKMIGERSSTILSGTIGGLISSTAVTASMTSKSHDKSGNTYAYASAVLIASLIMCIRVVAISGFYNLKILSMLTLPITALFIGLAGMAWYFYKKDHALQSKKTVNLEESYKSPFRLLPAIQFALIIMLVKFVAGIGLIYQDVISIKIFYSALGLISGLADVDAITMDMASKSSDGRIPLMVATTTILIAAISNNIVKAIIAYRLGEKQYGRSVALGFGISTALGLLVIIMMNLVLQGYAFG